MRPGVEGATRNAQYRVAPTSITPLAIHLGTVLGKKLPSGIEKQGNIVLVYRLVVKQAKSGQGVSGHANKQAHIRMLPDAQSQQAKVRAFYDMLYNRQKPECFSKRDSLGTSQGRRAIRLRSSALA